MDYKKLEKQQDLLLKIKEFDSLIISIEKLAAKVENDQAKLSLSLSVEQPVKEKVSMDEDGSLGRNSGFSFFIGGLNLSSRQEPETTKDKVKLSISDVYAYELLGAVLKQAQQERETAIQELQRSLKF